MSEHIINFRVYYEDTDSGGVVYYANYLKFAERARTELLRKAGISQLRLAGEENTLFVVKRAEMELSSPARLDDIITVKTTVENISGARITMRQEMLVNEKPVASVKVIVVCVNGNFRPIRVPAHIKKAI